MHTWSAFSPIRCRAGVLYSIATYGLLFHLAQTPDNKRFTSHQFQFSPRHARPLRYHLNVIPLTLTACHSRLGQYPQIHPQP